MIKWKLVPVEPSAQMLNAASRVAVSGALKASWDRMLEAAPQPPKLSDERIAELSYMHMNMYGFYDVAFARSIEREILGGGRD